MPRGLDKMPSPSPFCSLHPHSLSRARSTRGPGRRSLCPQVTMRNAAGGAPCTLLGRSQLGRSQVGGACRRGAVPGATREGQVACRGVGAAQLVPCPAPWKWCSGVEAWGHRRSAPPQEEPGAPPAPHPLASVGYVVMGDPPRVSGTLCRKVSRKRWPLE